MAAGATKVVISPRQRGILERLVRARRKTPQQLAERCRIVLMSAEGMENKAQAKELRVDRHHYRAGV